MSLTQAYVEYEREEVNRKATPPLIATVVICFIISYASVALRIASRRINKANLGADDWLMLLSILFTTALLSIIAALMHTGLDAMYKGWKPSSVSFLTAEIVYIVIIFIIKISTLFLWHRLFPSRSVTIALYIIGIVVTAYSLALMVSYLTQCQPFRKFWDTSIPGPCKDINAVSIVCASLNVVTDLSIVILPIIQLRRLNMKLRRKMQLALMFSLGSTVAVISIVRMTAFLDHSQEDMASGTLTRYVILSAFECAVATLAANLPTTKPVFSWLAQKTKDLRYFDRGSKAQREQGDRLTHHVERIRPDDMHVKQDAGRRWEDVVPLSEMPVPLYKAYIPPTEISMHPSLEARQAPH
ncbi:MAG: hypothetical protein M1820_004941 [Bogoriella megaspora]|nr:MAG: hypothetical protein M1820_004941 [Bogoriella megaspora]